MKATDREKKLHGEIRSMLKLAREATAAGSFSAAVSARSKVSGLRTELHRLRCEREARGITDPLERVQALAQAATEAGSYQAAAALRREEARIVEERARLATAKDDLADATDEEILDMLLGALRALPDTIVAEVRDACLEQLGGVALRVV